MPDNLAYVLNFDASPAFVIFPKFKKSIERDLWKDINLWEMRWSVAHEFGHHVFRTHSAIDDENSLRMMPIYAFNPD